MHKFLALLLLILLFSGNASAFTINPGQSLVIEFEFESIPIASSGVIDLLRLSGRASASSAIPINIDLYNGNTLLGSGTTGLAASWAFVTAGSLWGSRSNSIDADLNSVIDGTINGLIRITPVFNSSNDFYNFTLDSDPLQAGRASNTDSFNPASPSGTITSATVVPIPSALLLFGSALIGLFAKTRKKVLTTRATSLLPC